MYETTARVEMSHWVSGEVQDTQVIRQWSRSLSREMVVLSMRRNSGGEIRVMQQEVMTVRCVTLLQQEPASHAHIAHTGKGKGGGDR